MMFNTIPIRRRRFLLTDPLLVAVAMQKGSRHAAREGIALAERLEAPLHLAHVYHPEAQDLTEAEENLQRLAREADGLVSSVKTWFLEVPGDLASREEETKNALFRLFGEIGAQALVLASHSRPEDERNMLGGTASRILHGATCPCLFVPPMAPIGSRILVPVDGSSTSHRAAQLALNWARRLGADLDLVTVAGSRERSASRLEEAEARDILCSFAALAGRKKVSAVVHLRQGSAPKSIVALAEELASGLLVIGTHGRSGLGGWLIGSVADAVVRRAPCPVLVVPPEKR